MRPAASRLVTGCHRFVATVRLDGAKCRSGTPLASRVFGSPRARIQRSQLNADSLVSARAMATDGEPSPIVQYVVLRKDLGASLGWPLGSLCAQAAHASVAAVWEHRDHTDTVAYCAPDAIDQMHKVVLEVKGETQLLNLAAKLADAGVDHKLWMEQPENFATCLATRPYRKDEVAQWFKKCNLAKGIVVSGN